MLRSDLSGAAFLRERRGEGGIRLCIGKALVSLFAQIKIDIRRYISYYLNRPGLTIYILIPIARFRL